jgi:transposase
VLATAWVVMASDHYRFTIRQNVRFHDGTLMTAADVVASLRRASVPNSPYASVTHMIKEVQQSGPDTVDVMLRGPYPVLINDLAGISILSEAWMKAHGALLPTDPARDWVVRFNAEGPAGLIDRKAAGRTPLLSDAHRQALAAQIDRGPISAIHGVVRWRLCVLGQWLWEEFRVSVSMQTLSRELRAIGYRKLSARPKHHAQAEGAIKAFKKTSPPRWKASRASRASATTR